MTDTTTRRWYTEPETFIAVAALIVSVSAVVVGIYEASLQRHHDQAEVWPHVEIGVFTKQNGATIQLENTGIGPAIIKSVLVTVDGQPQANWSGVLRVLNGVEPMPFSNYSAAEHGLRPGDKIALMDVPIADQPHDFWKAIARVGMTICYTSVFQQHWVVESKSLGHGILWRDVAACPAQPINTEF